MPAGPPPSTTTSNRPNTSVCRLGSTSDIWSIIVAPRDVSRGLRRRLAERVAEHPARVGGPVQRAAAHVQLAGRDQAGGSQTSYPCT